MDSGGTNSASFGSFVAERDWQQFHTQKTRLKAFPIESAELLECFQWNSEADEETRGQTDVLTYCLLLTGINFDVQEIVERLE